METKQLVLTEKCNLNCKYCYIKQKDNMMSRETFLNIYQTFDKPYQIDLFGGEPLLNWDLITFIYGIVVKDENCKKINLYSNGLLLDDEKADFISSSKINYFWSYDGIWADYNVSELYIERVKKLTDFVAVQVGPPNLNMLENYVFFVNELGMTPTFTLMKDMRWTPGDVRVFRQQFKMLYAAYVNFFKNGKNYMPKIIYLTLKRLIAGVHNKESLPFCGAGERMNAYMPNGDMYPCARFGTEALLADDYTPQEECQNCQIDHLCDKGCYHQVVKYGVNKQVCELNRIVITGVIEMNNILKDNRRWKSVIKSIEREALCTE